MSVHFFSFVGMSTKFDVFKMLFADSVINKIHHFKVKCKYTSLLKCS
jgi:hypothetical protein